MCRKKATQSIGFPLPPLANSTGLGSACRGVFIDELDTALSHQSTDSAGTASKLRCTIILEQPVHDRRFLQQDGQSHAEHHGLQLRRVLEWADDRERTPGVEGERAMQQPDHEPTLVCGGRRKHLHEPGLPRWFDDQSNHRAPAGGIAKLHVYGRPGRPVSDCVPRTRSRRCRNVGQLRRNELRQPVADDVASALRRLWRLTLTNRYRSDKRLLMRQRDRPHQARRPESEHYALRIARPGSDSQGPACRGYC